MSRVDDECQQLYEDIVRLGEARYDGKEYFVVFGTLFDDEQVSPAISLCQVFIMLIPPSRIRSHAFRYSKRTKLSLAH